MRKLALVAFSSVLAFALFPAMGLAANVEGRVALSASDNLAGGSGDGIFAAETNAISRAVVTEVPYLDASGASLVRPEATEATADDVQWENDWYVVTGTVNATQRIVAKGDVHLILANGCTLDAPQGIEVSGGNSLTIYAQSASQAQAGSLMASGSGVAGIGGGGASTNCGIIVINGGNITAESRSGSAAIGGGFDGSCGTIVINAGNVTAEAGGSDGTGNGKIGAAIGCAGNGSGGSITIAGGTVVATGSGVNAAAIGGGASGGVPGGRCDSIVISGGHVCAEGGASSSSGNRGTGIGVAQSFSTGADGTAVIVANSISRVSWPLGQRSAIVTVDGNCSVYGDQALGEDLSIEAGKTLTVTGSSKLTVPSGITLTNNGTVESVAGSTLAVEGTLVNNGAIRNGGGLITGSGVLRGDRAPSRKPSAPAVEAVDAFSVALKPVADVGYGAVAYGCSADGGANITWQGDPVFTSLESGTEYRFYVRYAGNNFYTEAVSDAADESTLNYRVSYVGADGAQALSPEDVNVVRVSSEYLANNGGVLADGWYVVEERADAGALRVKIEGDVHLVLANGVRLTCDQGIGVSSGNSLTVYGQSNDSSEAGTLLATGRGSHAAIGGEAAIDCGAVIVNGGTVMARGGTGSAGIGGGPGGAIGTVQINGGFVRAFGGSDACAIGGGSGSGEGSVSVSGGSVEAFGNGAPAIGSTGADADGLRITISGGALRLASGADVPVIGRAGGSGAGFSMTGGLVYGVGNASAMLGCESIAMSGGALVFAPGGDENAAMTGHEVVVNDPATVFVGAFLQGIQVPAGTMVGDTPAITLPASGQASFMSTKGEQVAIISTPERGQLRFRGRNGKGEVFLPAGFVATAGSGASIVSPEGGMWLSSDGTVVGADEGQDDPATGPSGGDANSGAGSSTGDSGGSAANGSNNAKTSHLPSTGDDLLPAIALFAAVFAMAGITALRAARQKSILAHGRHARR